PGRGGAGGRRRRGRAAAAGRGPPPRGRGRHGHPGRAGRSVRLLPLGVRGSTPAPGAEFVRYGGHTSAVAVLGDGEAVPRLVLDAGTGLRDLPGLLGGEP